MTDVNGKVSICAFALSFLVVCAALGQDDSVDAAGSADEAADERFAFDREGDRCIVTRNIRSTKIINKRTILFRMRGGDHYVNHLAHDCNGLVRERRFSYESSAGRLCRVDHIRILEQFGGYLDVGMSCGLGLFYPVTREEAEFLALEPEERRGRPRIRVVNPNRTEDDAEENSE